MSFAPHKNTSFPQDGRSIVANAPPHKLQASDDPFEGHLLKEQADAHLLAVRATAPQAQTRNVTLKADSSAEPEQSAQEDQDLWHGMRQQRGGLCQGRALGADRSPPSGISSEAKSPLRQAGRTGTPLCRNRDALGLAGAEAGRI